MIARCCFKSQENGLFFYGKLCDEIGMRVIFGEANEKLVLTFIGERILILWDCLKPFMEKKRMQNPISDYQKYFEIFSSTVQQ